MDWCYYLSTLSAWFPWFCLATEQTLLQFLLLFSLFSAFTSVNYLHVLINFVLFIFLVGFELSFMQVGLFLGFFWVIEFTVIFIIVLLILYLNTKLILPSKPLKTNLLRVQSIMIVSLLSIPTAFIYNSENALMESLFIYYPADNIYLPLAIKQKNDFIGLFFSYYHLNSAVFLLVGMLLFIGSLVCVTLNILLKSLKKKEGAAFSTVFNFFNTHTNYLILRRQSLTSQNFNQPATKSILKKKWYKKVQF